MPRPALHRFARIALVASLLAALIPIAAPAPRASAQDPCSGLVAPRLTPGGQARVITPYGLSLKHEPLTGAAGGIERALLAFDTVATVTGSYRCNYGYRWWPLALANGVTGWAAEGGSGNDYYLEPVTVGLHVIRRAPGSAAIAHYFVTPDGRAEPQTGFTLPAVELTPGAAWQLVEIERLRVLLERAQTQCPARLVGTPFEGLDINAALALPLSGDEVDLYPAPDGRQLLVVQHLHLRVPRCETAIPERVGISLVSVIDAGGGVQELFPFPQHGSIPASTDVYAESEPGEWSVYLDEVRWSPHGLYIAIVAAYRDRCADAACLRYHVYVADLGANALYALGEGRQVGWTNGGEGLNLFRLQFGADGRQAAQLYTMRANGSDRQAIWLPGGAEYLSPEQTGFGFPWNASGTRVMVHNAGRGEVMLLTIADRSFSARVAVPDKLPRPNRLAVLLMRGETQYFWVTIRGEFVVQDVASGRWTELQSTLAPTGIAPIAVRPFATGTHVLIELADGSARVLDLDADRLVPVTGLED